MTRCGRPTGAAPAARRCRGSGPRCSQYTSIAFTDALVAAGIAGSIGSVGDCPRQRAHGVHDYRPVQDRVDRPSSQVVERPWRGRTRDRLVRPLVQHQQAPFVHRISLPERVRTRLPSTHQAGPLNPRGGLTQPSADSRAVQTVAESCLGGRTLAPAGRVPAARVGGVGGNSRATAVRRAAGGSRGGGGRPPAARVWRESGGVACQGGCRVRHEMAQMLAHARSG
jgi:hypothetical protein